MSTDTIKPLPHSIIAEKSVLSSLVRDPDECLHLVTEANLRADHFYLPAHRIIFDCLIHRLDNGLAMDGVSILQHFIDNGLLDRVGGPAAIHDLQTYAITPIGFPRHLEIVKEKSVLRSMIAVGGQIIIDAYERTDEPQDALDDAERSIMAIRDSNASQTPCGVNAALSTVVADMHRQIKGEIAPTGIKTGFDALDRLTGGLKPGQLFVIAARPSVGKSAFMMDIVGHVAFDLEKPTLVFSCEMTQSELIRRVIGSRARFCMARLDDGHKPDTGELRRIQTAVHTISKAKIEIDDTPQISISQLRAKARRAHRRLGVELIAIDYLQLLKSNSKQAQFSREREIAEISGALKGLAKELGVPIIILAQLNREVEKRTGASKGKPRMSDLRESGAIEQDADLVGLLSRDAYNAETETEKNEAGGKSSLDLCKNRGGATGMIWLNFIPELVRFEQGQKPLESPDRTKSRAGF